MRLINTETLQLETFNVDSAIPPYAILSHRWHDGFEVSFQDMSDDSRELIEGWNKIAFCCKQAKKDGIFYAWVDTCCIDKTSSSELSEAINSMFRWYQNAKICYAYLADVCAEGSLASIALSNSSWFTRSWTLQELLAPTLLKFYDVEWKSLGSRDILAEDIAEATGIHLSALTAQVNLDDYTVAQRMCWASRRTASRAEDIAYSLLGLFDVNMPLLYGEGRRAFERLQEEIIRQSHDESIFAWSEVDSELRWKAFPLLAKSPAAFINDRNVAALASDVARSYTITNLGLSISVPLILWAPDIWWAGINCSTNSYDQLGIFVTTHPHIKDVYCRTTPLDRACIALPTDYNSPELLKRQQITITTRATSPSLKRVVQRICRMDCSAALSTFGAGYKPYLANFRSFVKVNQRHPGFCHRDYSTPVDHFHGAIEFGSKDGIVVSGAIFAVDCHMKAYCLVIPNLTCRKARDAELTEIRSLWHYAFREIHEIILDVRLGKMNSSLFESKSEGITELKRDTCLFSTSLENLKSYGVVTFRKKWHECRGCHGYSLEVNFSLMTGSELGIEDEVLMVSIIQSGSLRIEQTPLPSIPNFGTMPLRPVGTYGNPSTLAGGEGNTGPSLIDSSSHDRRSGEPEPALRKQLHSEDNHMPPQVSSRIMDYGLLIECLALDTSTTQPKSEMIEADTMKEVVTGAV